ncbi:DUF4231 domain-containing protein [Streptomyces sp. NPDC056682]|uniref:DUF4231 domain-containing protein n=1 Tax=Streptomyces sp. NPDC056682 TaxID=3345909 RepID=UPI0036832698
MLIPRRTPSEPFPASDDPLLAHAHMDLAWYARTRDRARRWHRTVELSALLTGAGTVVAAGLQAPAAITAVMAGATVFIGGFRQVFNHLERYVLASEAWSRLRLAIQRYTLVPESERDEVTRGRLLDEIEAVAMTELRDWAASRRGTQPGPLPGGPPPA